MIRRPYSSHVTYPELGVCSCGHYQGTHVEAYGTTCGVRDCRCSVFVACADACALSGPPVSLPPPGLSRIA